MNGTSNKKHVKTCIMKRNEHPYVFVAGMAGWGEKSKISYVVPYWGCFSFNITSFLKENGICAASASISPLGSAWDRACELYAELTGTRVDYGKAHSEKFNHERYGATYEKPLIPCWGKKDSTGKIRKINLVAHSFGGPSVRLLAHLLAEGSAEEREATTDGSLSPLFKGGQSDLIFSITTICAPHNGTTMQKTMAVPVASLIKGCYFVLNDVVANSAFDDWYLVRLEHFGIGSFHHKKGDASFMNTKEMKRFAESEDNVFFDVSVEGSAKLNSNLHTFQNIYYFSFAVQGTEEKIINGKTRHVPTDAMLPALKGFSKRLGRFMYKSDIGIDVDESWLANDGVVNTVSQKSPLIEPAKDFDKYNIPKGIWNVMPTVTGNHGTIIGLGADDDFVKSFYLDHFSIINELSRTEAP